jgi:hypothetical protein
VTGANNTVIAWKINRIEDQFFNYLVFEYLKSANKKFGLKSNDF